MIKKLETDLKVQKIQRRYEPDEPKDGRKKAHTTTKRNLKK